MSKSDALRWLAENSPVVTESYTTLGAIFGWQRATTWKVVQEWKRKNYLETATDPGSGNLTVAVHPTAIPIIIGSDAAGDDPEDDGSAGSDLLPAGASALPEVASARSAPAAAQGGSVPEAATETVYAHVLPRPPAPAPRAEMSALDVLTVLAALSLTACAATLSVRGMLVLFPGIPLGAMWLGGGIEACKLTAAAWIGHRWGDIGWTGRLALFVLVVAAAALNMVGVYGQLVEGHVGARAQVSAGIETSDAQAAARIEAVQGRLADVDRRIALNDAIVNGAAARGRANGAAEALRRQRTERASLVKERQGIAQEVANLKSDRAGQAAKGKAVEAEALPVQYVAQLFGIQAGGEEVIRWFIAGLVACGDPFAIILLGVVMSRRRRS
jgi:hypothetical protein